ncbi:hypothetical protein AB0E77_12865 [Streptomyces sp. NPDC032940]|uniref:hypothetical protein n=1 Tax=Streptomyces sp. NPDC032940 TaxID=3155366 RepID=UPI0033CF99D5
MTDDLTGRPAHVQLQAPERREISSRELLDLHLAQLDAAARPVAGTLHPPRVTGIAPGSRGRALRGRDDHITGTRCP